MPRTGILTVHGVPLAINGEYLGAADTIEGLRPEAVKSAFLRANADSYLGMLRWLLPRGWAWRGQNLTNLIRALADSFARVHAAIVLFLVVECDPRTTESMLLDWERAYGLPDPCAGDEEATLQQRRSVLHAKVKMKGGQSIAFLEELAAGSGNPVEIEEYRMMMCIDPCTGNLFAERWVHVFALHSSATTIYEAVCTDLCTVALRTWGIRRLECMLNRARPAHTVAIFSYSSEA